MRREAELIRQLVKGAAAIGDTELEERFQVMSLEPTQPALQ